MHGYTFTLLDETTGEGNLYLIFQDVFISMDKDSCSMNVVYDYNSYDIHGNGNFYLHFWTANDRSKKIVADICNINYLRSISFYFSVSLSVRLSVFSRYVRHNFDHTKWSIHISVVFMYGLMAYFFI